MDLCLITHTYLERARIDTPSSKIPKAGFPQTLSFAGAGDYSPRKTPKRVYNAARWGFQAASVSGTVAVSLPSPRETIEAKLQT